MRGRLLAITITTTLALATAGASLAARTPEQACEGGKVDTAGRYFACVAKAENALVANGDTARYDLAVSKCTVRFSGRWNSFEVSAVAAGTTCPSEGDSSAVLDFLNFCEQSVALAVGGGTLPGDCVPCDGDLAACEADLATAEGDFAACASGLGTCNTSLSSALTNLTTCGSSLTTCTGSLGTCNSDLSTTNVDLTTCSANLGSCTGSLGTCNGNLSICNSDLSSTNADLTSCNGDLATANAGTAAVGEVLIGKTFTSTAGLGATGAMPSNGAVTLTPTTSDQAIAAGYHDGTGKCAGDADLIAGNVKNGVNLFGVEGIVTTGGSGHLPKTGQTTSYGAGSDGAAQRGTARSFTDNGDGTITDNVTGLMWEKKSDDGSIHDKDNTYTWGMTTAPSTMNGTMVTTFLAALNGGGGFAGYTDWRIPNVHELQSLVNFAVSFPSAFPEFNSNCVGGCSVTTTCSCTRSDYDWSSTTLEANPDYAWVVDFYNGSTASGGKTTGLYVRAVRAGS